MSKSCSFRWLSVLDHHINSLIIWLLAPIVSTPTLLHRLMPLRLSRLRNAVASLPLTGSQLAWVLRQLTIVPFLKCRSNRPRQLELLTPLRLRLIYIAKQAQQSRRRRLARTLYTRVSQIRSMSETLFISTAHSSARRLQAARSIVLSQLTSNFRTPSTSTPLTYAKRSKPGVPQTTAKETQARRVSHYQIKIPFQEEFQWIRTGAEWDR